jgi:hypothetical protein
MKFILFPILVTENESVATRIIERLKQFTEDLEMEQEEYEVAELVDEDDTEIEETILPFYTFEPTFLEGDMIFHRSDEKTFYELEEDSFMDNGIEVVKIRVGGQRMLYNAEYFELAFESAA